MSFAGVSLGQISKKTKVFILAGQSNMDGRGEASKLSEAEMKLLANASQKIHFVYKGTVGEGNPIRYNGALDFTNPWNFVKQKFRVKKCFGPELFFGVELVKNHPKHDYLFIKRSQGGTSLYGAWNPNWSVKKASFFNEQDKPKLFANKIKRICNTRQSNDFMVIARIESFILGKGLNDALKRAEIYSKAGADAILIHSKEKNTKEIFSFAKKFRKNKYFIPLVSVPSTYSKVYEKDLIKNGFKLVIYANQLLRAAYPAMQNTAKTILKNSRAFEADKKIITYANEAEKLPTDKKVTIIAIIIPAIPK